MGKVNQINLNTQEVKEFLHHIIQNNRYLQKQGKLPAAVEISGGSGLGKTSTILQLASELGLSSTKLNLAQIEELGDLIGFPIRQFELCKETFPVKSVEPVYETRTQKVVKQVPVESEIPVQVQKTVKQQVLKDGKMQMVDVVKTVTEMKKVVKMTAVEVEEEVKVLVENPVSNDTACIWVDENAVSEYLKHGYTFTGNKRMSYCPPEWISGKDNGGILILDDWTRADQRFIQAVMELIDRQEYISWKLPKDWHIILTSNPDNGDYLVQSIDSAQRTRFISVNLKFDEQVWATWAEKEKIDSRCINFLLLHPEIVKEDVNPRSITTFFNAISSIEDFDKDLPLIQMIGEGSVGPEFSTMFTSFIHNKLDKIPHPSNLIHEKDLEQMRMKMIRAMGKGDSYRADIASVLATRVINYSLTHAETKPVDDIMIRNLIEMTTGEDLFTKDLSYHIVKKLLNGNRQKFQKMMNDPAVMKMTLA